MVENKELIKRFQRVASDRTTVQQQWDAIEAFVTPYRGRFFKDQKNEHSIEWEKRDIYDSTAPSAHINLSSAVHGGMTSPSIRWFDMIFRQIALNEDQEASKWLQEAVDTIYYELQDSNFNLEINEYYQDICGFATAFLTLEEADGPKNEWNGLNFTAIPLKEGYFETDHRGRVLRFYRKLQWTAAQIISRFGDQVPQKVLDLEEKGSTDKMDCLFVIFPRHNRIIPTGQKQSPSRRPIAYRYMLLDDGEELGKEGSYYEMPAYVGRWRTTSESIWGNGPAHIGLADILEINEVRKVMKGAGEKALDPPILAEERSIFSDLDLSAASLNIVRSIEGIKPLPFEGSLPWTDDTVSRLQEAIREYFFTDKLVLPAPQATPMSATEFQRRYEELNRFMGPTTGRIINDTLDPTISRAFRMLARAGKIPEPPQSVIEANAGFDILYLGSMSRAQRIDEAASIERWMGSAAAMGEVFPESLDVVDAEEAMRHTGRNLNVPAAIIRDKDAVKKAREEREARQAAMAEALQAKAEGDAATAVGEGKTALQAAGQEEEEQQ